MSGVGGLDEIDLLVAGGTRGLDVRIADPSPSTVFLADNHGLGNAERRKSRGSGLLISVRNRVGCSAHQLVDDLPAHALLMKPIELRRRCKW